MTSLNEGDWYQNCIYKIKYVEREIELLREKEKLDMYDEIKINTLLNVLKSPMEYATRELSNKFGKNSAFIPFRKSEYTDQKYRNILKEKIGYVDNKIYNIYNELFNDTLYQTFNNMHNSEKHVEIGKHRKEVTHTTEFSVYPNNIIVQNLSIKGPEGFNPISINEKKVDLTDYHYEEKYYFLYENDIDEEVFSFLNKVKKMVVKFIDEINLYIQSMPN